MAHLADGLAELDRARLGITERDFRYRQGIDGGRQQARAFGGLQRRRRILGEVVAQQQLFAVGTAQQEVVAEPHEVRREQEAGIDDDAAAINRMICEVGALRAGLDMAIGRSRNSSRHLIHLGAA